MIGTEPPKTKARRRGKPIEVWVNEEEKAQITARAEQSGLSRSGYLRAVGLNYPIRSVVDLAAVADLARVNGDLALPLYHRSPPSTGLASNFFGLHNLKNAWHWAGMELKSFDCPENWVFPNSGGGW